MKINDKNVFRSKAWRHKYSYVFSHFLYCISFNHFGVNFEGSLLNRIERLLDSSISPKLSLSLSPSLNYFYYSWGVMIAAKCCSFNS